ncbi:NADP-dependent 3-hydroxy acid dehydrogenase YdfG [Motilibacter peucedani]|uniref:NADP-dependent 3-hydroxy acid dehydrogenase YdfG n=1 Tax=Motilibacter peucedani TaxID=598650 RepID=A0A420XT54_9ACTN|nr:SDR family NAD(P)-dependent oxidoreductase [Motilibacter peucedani]RKS77919.1 NADP-dependent 3-hydroxy acid dehydrogenase YdfG [Motilibacter peucedani]
MSLSDSVVVVTGAGGGAGQAVVRRLVRSGANVVAADRRTVDLLDEAATREWARWVEREHGRVDGVVHLVGGWRGAKTFTDASTADAEWLHGQLVRTLQHVSLAFHDALVASPAARFAIVSATAVTSPTAGGAAYASAKAAAEAWTFALADSFRRSQSGRKADPTPQRAAAAVLVVKALVTEAMRQERPDASYAGSTDVDELADSVARLWDTDAAELNGSRIILAR